MSNNVVPMQVVLQRDPLVDFENLDKRMYSVIDGGQYLNYQEYIATQVSNSSVSVLSIPSSEHTVVDPKIYMRATYTLTFAGTSTSGNLLQIGTGADAPRAYPLHKSISTLTSTLNGQSISWNASQLIDPFLRYQSDYQDQSLDWGTTPVQLDQCQQYSDLYLTNRSPFVKYGDNVLQPPRAAFSSLQIVSNTPTAAVVNLTVYERLFLPLFIDNCHGLLGVTNLNHQLTFRSGNQTGFSGLAPYIWSHDSVNGNNITSCVCNITALSMFYAQITPKILFESKIPKQLIYPYSAIIPSVSSRNGPFAPGAQIQIPMNALNLQSIPRFILLYVRQQDSEQSIDKPDAYWRIDNVNIVYQNQSGILASAPTQALYQRAHMNGFNGTWDDWNKNTGSVLKLVFGCDIALSSLYSESQLVTNQLSMVVTATNISNYTFDVANLFVQVCYSGTATIGNNTMQLNTSVLTNADVLNAQMDTKVIPLQKSTTMLGGSLIDSLGNLWNSGVQVAKDIEPYAEAAVKGLSMLGLGGNISGAGVVGGKRGRKKKGGALIDRAELSGMADRYEEY